MVLMSGNWARARAICRDGVEASEAQSDAQYTFCGIIQFSLESDMISVQRQVMNSNELKRLFRAITFLWKVQATGSCRLAVILEARVRLIQSLRERPELGDGLSRASQLGCLGAARDPGI
jgi:hypothetical protein